ncbi:MAG TPA: TIGR02996 domain-containing protein [Gemmata sp.]|jgi:uncharacterized protein (TIGR02996 family)|nr:TIGR02996 domain-containing protein [Gemmata sp.]
MNDGDALLAAILANPDDDTPRLVYADWLQENGRPEWAEYLRLGVEAPRLKKGKKRSQLESRIEELRGRLDGGWLALLATLGVPFRERQFSFEPGRHPFIERIGARGSLFTFESQFRTHSQESGLVKDIQLLHGFDLGECYYGSASYPIYPFLAELTTPHDTLTAPDVLTALKVRSFRSQHIPNLNATTIPFPGYHPVTDNDEIHTDPGQTHLFVNEEDLGEGDPVVLDPNATATLHDTLRRYVTHGQLWYVLLHTWRDQTWHSPEEDWRTKDGIVILFAVGRSPHGGRLVGVVSSQMCHNFCD